MSEGDTGFYFVASDEGSWDARTARGTRVHVQLRRSRGVGEYESVHKRVRRENFV
jgi:hypothetical protein